MNAKRALDRFRWERAVLGPEGPQSATMRLVLVAIGMHVRRGTLRAWPSVTKLEAATHLTRHTILGHIETAIAQGWLQREKGRVRCRLKTMQGLEEGTVWTWNAVAKQAGAWGLPPEASEITRSFLLNHLIAGRSDPITGQAAWFDLKVRVYK